MATTVNGPRAAALYVRISDDRPGQKLGVKRQTKDCHSQAERRGWPVAEVYEDDDRSAFSGKPRPAYQRMLDDIKNGERDAVVVWDHYRLVRRPIELEEFFQVCDAAGVRHLATYSGDIDLGTEDGRMFARMLGAVAHKESADKSRRIKRKHLELAENGFVSGGGARPYGYMKDRVTLVPAEADVIREAARRVLAGDSLRSICNDFIKRGIPGPSGGLWRPSVLRTILRSARASGQREHRGQIVAKAVWPAIITPDETTRLRALFDDPARKHERPPRSYLLSGLLRCATCGATLISRPMDTRNRRYVCYKGPSFNGCGRLTVTAPTLEDFVLEMILFRLDTKNFAAAEKGEAARSASEATASRELDDANIRLDELAQLFGEGTISVREYMAARKPLEARVERASKALSRLRRTTALDSYIGAPDALRRDWPTLSLPRQQAIVKAFANHFTINPTSKRGRNSFGPERVTPAWRL